MTQTRTRVTHSEKTFDKSPSVLFLPNVYYSGSILLNGIFMAAFVLIAVSVGVDLYHVAVRCSKTGFSITNIIQVFQDLHDEILTSKYIDCIDEIYENKLNSESHSIGIDCVNCRRKSRRKNMMCPEIEDALEVDGGEEAFEFLSHDATISESQSKLVCENSSTFNLEVPVVLSLGTSIYVCGTILNNCEGFAVNLTLGHTHNDIALHVNPRLQQNYIVRNSKINGRWGKEETTASMPFKLKRGERFGIQILVTDDRYMISVNGLHFTTYAYRIPYQRVTCVQVRGDVCDAKIEHLPIMEYPDRSEQADLIHNIDLIESFDKALIKKTSELVMPYYGRLVKKLINGSKLHIVGRVKVLPYSFYINLQQSDMIWPHPTIPFHFNVRFTTIGGKNVIVKNSWLDGKWDREERSEIHTDFMPSRTFHLQIIYNSDAYHVFLNDKLIAEFMKRTDPSIVDTVFIYGDIKLKYVSQEPEKAIA